MEAPLHREAGVARVGRVALLVVMFASRTTVTMAKINVTATVNTSFASNVG